MDNSIDNVEVDENVYDECITSLLPYTGFISFIATYT